MESVSKAVRDPVVDRAASLLIAVAGAQGDINLASHARALGIPLSSAYRIATTLARHGLLAQGLRGHYGPGLALAGLGGQADPRAILARTARPLARRLARKARATAHLGVFEGDMVTYLIKESRGVRLFTQEGGQLEAYCSAIGKVLLAHLEADEIERYLMSAPFIALTVRTVTDPVLIRNELVRVRAAGFAIDDREIADDLVCMAVPVRDPGGTVIAAVSLSRRADVVHHPEPPAALMECARAIEARLGSGSFSE